MSGKKEGKEKRRSMHWLVADTDDALQASSISFFSFFLFSGNLLQQEK